MKRSRFSIYATTGVLTVAVVIPMATALLSDGGHYSETLQEQALANQPELRAARRALTRLNARCAGGDEDQDVVCEAYAIVQRECFTRQKKYFQDSGCPEINDMPRILQVQEALEAGQPVPSAGEAVSSAGAALRPAADSGALTLSDLPPSERLAMRRAVRLQYCSKKLPTAMYLLCVSLLGNDVEGTRPAGFGNDLQQMRSSQHSAQPSTLKDRIEMTVPVER